jgi:hypothetical protein
MEMDIINTYKDRAMNNNDIAAINIVDSIFGELDSETLLNNDRQFQQLLDEEEEKWSDLQESDNEDM